MHRHAVGGYKRVRGGSGGVVVAIVIGVIGVIVIVSSGLWSLDDPLAAGGAAGVDPQPLVHALG